VSVRDSYPCLTCSEAWAPYYMAENKANVTQNKKCMPLAIGDIEPHVFIVQLWDKNYIHIRRKDSLKNEDS